MFKKTLCMLAALTAPTLAGSLKVHQWETVTIPVPKEVCTIDLLIDVGYYITIEDQSAIILKQQYGTTNFSETFTSLVRTNFDATLSATITPTGVVGIEDLGIAFLNDSEFVLAGVDNVIEIRIVAQQVHIDELIGGEPGQKIAELTISVTPGLGGTELNE